MTDITDLVDRLHNISRGDHKRGCTGRQYVCSCGYDDDSEKTIEEAADLIQRQAEEVAAAAWKPIETAPQNTAVIASRGDEVGEACWIIYSDGPSGWYWAASRDPMPLSPTHWMPLPAPPALKSEGSGNAG